MTVECILRTDNLKLLLARQLVYPVEILLPCDDASEPMRIHGAKQFELGGQPKRPYYANALVFKCHADISFPGFFMNA